MFENHFIIQIAQCFDYSSKISLFLHIYLQFSFRLQLIKALLIIINYNYFLPASMYWYYYCVQQLENIGLPFPQYQEVHNYKLNQFPLIIINENKNNHSIEVKPQTQLSLFINLSRQDLEKFGQSSPRKLWSEDEDKLLISLSKKHNLDWEEISKYIPERNAKMCYSRFKRLEYSTKNSWKKREQDKLLYLIGSLGLKWKQISEHMENRTAKQVKQHYVNYLRPGITRNQWSLQQDIKLVQLLNTYGPSWKKIQQAIPDRSENQIKNRYFGRLKKLQQRKLQIIEVQNGNLFQQLKN